MGDSFKDREIFELSMNEVSNRAVIPWAIENISRYQAT